MVLAQEAEPPSGIPWQSQGTRNQGFWDLCQSTSLQRGDANEADEATATTWINQQLETLNIKLVLQGGSRDTILIPRYSLTPSPHHCRNGIQTYAVDY